MLHEQVVLLTVDNVRIPEVPAERRMSAVCKGNGFWHVTLRYGFMEHPDVPAALRQTSSRGLDIDLARASYYLGRETLLPTGRSKMAKWRKSLFAYVSRNARPATAYFGLPPNRVVELGMQIDF